VRQPMLTAASPRPGRRWLAEALLLRPVASEHTMRGKSLLRVTDERVLITSPGH